MSACDRTTQSGVSLTFTLFLSYFYLIFQKKQGYKRQNIKQNKAASITPSKFNHFVAMLSIVRCVNNYAV